ncbi:MAG: DUF5320 domain-containing protein [Phycisphaerae bacterium]
MDATGPNGLGPHNGRGMGRCRQTGNTNSCMGGGRRRIRNAMGQLATEPARSNPPSPSSSSATGADIADLKQQVQQLTETVQNMARKLQESPPASTPK